MPQTTDAARGYWDTVGTPAAVDWCEPNYAVSPWVAEWWNTLSSVAILVAGIVGLVLWARARERTELRFAVCYLALAVIGLGSVAFHGTLLKLPQASDELPMIWLSLVCFYCLVTRRADTPKQTRVRWQLGLSGYGVLFTAAYFTLEDYFVAFLVSYGAVVAYISIVTFRVAFREMDSPTLKRLFRWSVVAYLGGFFLLWIPERTLGCDHTFQLIHPHAFFHLSSSIGTYAWVMLSMFDRLTRLKKSPRVVGPVPFVEH